MPSSEHTTAAITPQGVRDGYPAVLGALAARRGPAVIAFATEVCEPAHVVRAAADAFARFRGAVADPGASLDVDPDTLLLNATRRAVLGLAPLGPDGGCAAVLEPLALRAEHAIEPSQASLLNRHLETCEHCRDLAEGIEAGEEAYRDTELFALTTDQMAPIVAAMAAVAPVALPEGSLPPLTAVPEDDTPPADLHLVPVEAAPDAPVEQAAEPVVEEAPSEPAPVADEVAAQPIADPTEPEPLPAAAPRTVAQLPAPLQASRSSYYELPPVPRRARAVRAQRAARTALNAARGAAALAGRTGTAARDRFGHTPASPPPPGRSGKDDDTPAPAAATASWQRIEEIEFPARTLPASVPTVPAAPQASATAEPPAAAAPPRRRRRPGDLALPTGLLAIAVLVVLAVTGVFGGDSPSSGAGRTLDAAQTTALQSATAVSLDQAARQLPATGGTTTP